MDRFRRVVRSGRLGSAFLFVGPAGVGKKTFALQLAKALLCEESPPSVLDACRECGSCQQVAAGTHPDLLMIAKPENRSFIPVELFIGDREHRMRSGLCHDLSLMPYQADRKVALIDDADYLNAEGANCLLKTLEEPPADSLLILIGTSEHRQLPTIRSRCQVVRFGRLADEEVDLILKAQTELAETSDRARAVARSGGSVSRALQMADPETIAACEALIGPLAQSDFDSLALIKATTQSVDAAGKDAPARRARLRTLVLAAVEFYRRRLTERVGQNDPTDPAVELLVECIERCLLASAQIDSNANLSSLIAAWIDDLSQRSLGLS